MSTTSIPIRQGTGAKRSQYFRTLILFLVLIALLYFALRNAPLIEIWHALRQLQLSQIAALLLLNTGVIFAIAARWWFIVRADNPSIPFLPLVKYRLAVFGLSYFTPGPQVGGEPLQIFYLQQNHGVPFARATSAVIMDKLLEFLSNSIWIGAGLTVAIRMGMISRNGTQLLGSLSPLIAILILPILHLVMLHRGRYPVSNILRAVSPLVGNPGWIRLIIVSERMAASFTRRRLPALLGSLFFSMLALAGTTWEYFLMTSFLRADLSIEQSLAGLTAGMIAFLMPLPGGLGALEASQVYALTSMGYAPAIGISLSLIMRARDILNGGFGLLLAGKFIREIGR